MQEQQEGDSSLYKRFRAGISLSNKSLYELLGAKSKREISLSEIL